MTTQMNDKPFIVTKDSASAKILKDKGFHQISFDGYIYTFVNEGVLNFDVNEFGGKVHATSRLCF